MADIGLYNYPKRFASSIELMRKENGICEEDKENIVSFSKIRLAKGSSHGRVAKIVYCIRFLAIWLGKPFGQATKEDLIVLVGELENKNLSDHTRYDFKIVLKMFYRWLKGNDEIFPKEISWLKPKLKNEKHKLPEDLLTEEEVLKLAESAENIRDRAFVLTLYESGCRIGEILTIKLKNIIFDNYGAILRVTGKTGDRRVRIISSAPTLGSWIGIHPNKNDPESKLWYSTWRNKNKGNRNLSHGTVYVLLNELVKKANIRKKIYPHLFRHSRATALANKLTEAQMKEHFGWVQGSDMAATYVHLSGRDVDDAFLKLQGLVKKEDEHEEKIKVKLCQRCKEHNSPIAKFCIKCGLPMDVTLITDIENERKNADNIMNRLMEDKEFRALAIKKIMELDLKKNL